MGHWEDVDRVVTRHLNKTIEQEKNRVPRVFVTDRYGTTASMSHDQYYGHAGVSPTASAAFDILHDDGMPAEQAWKMALAMDKNRHLGDAEAQARHFVELRKAYRSMDVS